MGARGGQRGLPPAEEGAGGLSTRPYLKATDGGVLLELHVQPRAHRSSVEGQHGDALKVKLAAPPVDGEANAELLRFLAELFSIPRSSVTLLSGDKSRRKRVRLAGVDLATAERLIPEG